MIGEIGSASNKLKVYRNNVLKNKKKNKLKLEKKKQVFIIKNKKKSKLKSFLMILLGFIFGFFENLANKSNKKNKENLKKDNIYASNKQNLHKHTILKKDNFTCSNSFSKNNLYKDNKITYITICKKEKNNNINKSEEQIKNDKICDFTNNYVILHKQINNNKFDTNLKTKLDKKQKKFVISKENYFLNKQLNKKENLNLQTCNNINIKNLNIKKIKKINNKINLLNEQKNTNKIVELKNQNKKEKNKNVLYDKKNILSNKEDISSKINNEDIKKGMDIISKHLKKQMKFIDEKKLFLKEYKEKINYKLKINYFSIFINNSLKAIASFLPITIFKNKLFGTLISTILINNTIKVMKNEIDLKNNAKIIVPKYLNEIENQNDIINSIYDVCLDSSKQVDLLKTQFIIKNHMYSETVEYKQALESLNLLEMKIEKSLEEIENIIKEKKQIEIQTKRKIYKIIKN